VEPYTNTYLPARNALDEKETGRLIDLRDNAALSRPRSESGSTFTTLAITLIDPDRSILNECNRLVITIG
jgi:hypothetical protein